MSDTESDFESWSYSWEGKAFNVEEKRVQVKKQLTEYEDIRMAQRHVFALARYKDTKDSETIKPAMLKIRYDIDPRPFGIEDLEENKDTVHEHVLFEMELIRLLHSIGHGPKLLGASYSPQASALPHPGGNVYSILLERVPGDDLDEIKDVLSYAQLRSVRKQLTRILEAMRCRRRFLTHEDRSCFRYDRENNKLYLVDLTYWGYQFMDNIVINEDSPFVLAFGLWKDDWSPRIGNLPMHLRPNPVQTGGTENTLPGNTRKT